MYTVRIRIPVSFERANGDAPPEMELKIDVEHSFEPWDFDGMNSFALRKLELVLEEMINGQNRK